MGPSPRARGAAPRGGTTVDGGRTIPACAGSRRSLRARIAVNRDHPRVRGEQRTVTGAAGIGGGPSPRARGAGVWYLAGRAPGGTIPACAGSRPALSPDVPDSGDHPRVRGEQEAWPLSVTPGRGPSPRARGADPARHARPRPRGTIPACAGSRGTFGRHLYVDGDHPRVRGEQRCGIDDERSQWGPSPRARGAERPRPQLLAPVGTIPACAGSSRP